MRSTPHIQFPALLATAWAILAAPQWLGQVSGQAFDPPQGGWTYIFNGDAAASPGAAALDGSWNHDNGSDAWDGTGPGTGAPGGAGVFTEGADTFLRIQDTGNPNDYGFSDPANRKVYFTRDIGESGLGASGVSDTFLDEGVTFSFRARVPTTGVLDNLHPDDASGVVPWPAGGDGMVVFDNGKTTFSLQQRAGTAKSVAFALALPSDRFTAGAPGGLLMNRQSGNVPSGDVDDNDTAGTANILELDDPTQWHEFWIAIRGTQSGVATHEVSVWMDGESATAGVFLVTAGTGTEGPGNSVLGMGSSPTGLSGAVDVDFVAVRSGWIPPIPLCELADLDGSGLIDLADLAILRNNFYVPGLTPLDGDLNFDGNIDLVDYRIWTVQRDSCNPTVSIPEPAALTLLLLPAAWAVLGGRRRG